MTIYDLGIIGAGISGVFAAYKMAKENKTSKVFLIDLGRPPAKRRRFLEGWLGVLPNSDGKLYEHDQEKISTILGTRKAKSSVKWATSVFSNSSDLKIIKDKTPSVSAEKRIKKAGYEFYTNNYSQLFPKEIHALSKFFNNQIESSGNITYSFDNEVYDITKQKGIFHINSQGGEFKCKKLLITVGRSGWRWANKIYSKFGIVESNDVARYGVRLEMPALFLKDFNKSNCTIYKDNMEIGPFSWNGTIIPEDHVDLAISTFRSNENRWKTDKVSFNFIGSIPMKDGVEEIERIGALTFLLSNDRILKEKVSLIMSDKSKVVSIMKEYNWLKNELTQLSSIIPDILTKAHFHVPTLVPMVPNINIGTNLETELDGLFVAGESAGVSGILSAAAMGSAAIDGIFA